MRIRYALPDLVLLSLLAAATALLSMDLQAQGRVRLKDVNERLVRVENVLDNSLLEMLQQNQALQAEVRQLRGELEGLSNDLNRTRQKVGDYQQLQKQLSELRQQLQQLQARQTVAADDSEGAVPGDEPLTIDPDSADAADAADTEGGTASQQDIDTAASRDYQAAFALVQNRQFTEAITAYDRFLTRFPSHKLASNAWYWQGEAMYAERNFEDALANFQVLIDTFPSSGKVPDADLKIGFALMELGYGAEAREQLEFVRSRYDGQNVAALAEQRLLKLGELSQ